MRPVQGESQDSPWRWHRSHLILRGGATVTKQVHSITPKAPCRFQCLVGPTQLTRNQGLCLLFFSFVSGSNGDRRFCTAQCLQLYFTPPRAIWSLIKFLLCVKEGRARALEGKAVHKALVAVAEAHRMTNDFAPAKGIRRSRFSYKFPLGRSPLNEVVCL